MKLKKVQVNAYGGINPSSPVILDFTQTNWWKVEGDFGTNKTSLIDAILTGLAQKSKDDKDRINIASGKIDINVTFVGSDRKEYEIRCSKSKLELRYSGGSIPEPVTMIRELIGPVGTTPMVVKEAKLSDIIKWLAAYSNKSAEQFEKEMLKFKEGIKDAEKSRADSNRSLKGLNEYLETEPMFTNWEESEKTYTKDVDVKKLSEELTEAGKKSDKYIRAEEKLKQLKDDKDDTAREIEDLRIKLAAKEKELLECNDAIEKGEKYLKDYKSDKTEYDAVRKRYDRAALDKADYDKWQEIKKKKKERDQFETASQLFDTVAKDLARDRKVKQSEILPDIKGVELVTDDVTEDGVMKKEGLYYQGKNVRQLSETEWWALVMQIWKKYKVRIIVIDNYQSLGSYGAELLGKLSKDGAYILTAEMNREQKTLEIYYE